MSSDRTIYDEGAFQVKTKESTKPLHWILGLHAHESCMVCGDKPNVTKHAERVDVENDLFGINRKLSNDPRMKYQKSDVIAKQLNYAPPYLCERNITHDSFLEKTERNKYMENLRRVAPENINYNTNLLDKLTNYPNITNIDSSNRV